MGRVGVWLFGARGSVATTTIAGAAALRHGLPPAGMVTASPAFAAAGLVPVEELVFGGHDVAEVPLAQQVERLITGGVLPTGLDQLVAAELDAVERDVVVVPQAGHPLVYLRQIADELRAFRRRHQLDQVVAINVASTEPPVALAGIPSDLASLRAALADGDRVLPVSSLHALAAFEAGAAYVDFTPSTSIRPAAVRAWAADCGVPFGGQDAKTGETLVKSVLAPMFAARALPVHAWSGTNLLGGGDGATLADPRAAESKRLSKDRTVGEVLGKVPGEVHIDHVEPLGEWKTAWDHIAFSGFLGVRMTMQFTWQGCDSALAAPLVLDLARLSALALGRGHSGSMPFLGFYFKDPIDSNEHSLVRQYDELLHWVRAC